MFIHEAESYVICKMAAILFKPQCDNFILAFSACIQFVFFSKYLIFWYLSNYAIIYIDTSGHAGLKNS